MSKTKGKRTAEKRLTRYTHDEAPETRVPETGHTSLLPGDEIVVTLGMDNGWSKAVEVGKLNAKADSRVIVDMDPIHDPTVFWAGKMNRREIAVLPLQRNEIVSDSRIGQIIERARRLASTGKGQAKLTGYFSDLEKALRENDKEKRVEFYSHDGGWKNKLVCGDSLQVMESLVHYEGLRGKVQMMYIDPPYGIAYDSNFQQRIDSTKNDDKDKADDVLTIKAFRDTWALGIHSYLSYLQERLYLCRELLSESGSIFVQMNQETAHLVRAILDEVFGAKNFVSLIVFTKTGGQSSALLSGVYDLLLWYAKDKDAIRYNQIYLAKEHGGPGTSGYTFVENPDGTEWRPMTAMEQRDPSSIPAGWRVFDGTPLASAGEAKGGPQSFEYLERRYTTPPNSHWKTTAEGMRRLAEKNRIIAIGNRIEYKRYFDDFPFYPLDNIWLGMGERGFVGEKLYAVQTDWRVVARCILMTTQPGDLVFDPTCGSGTTAYCAERLGRRWITCDTSRVALNVARRRLLSVLFDHYKTRTGKISGDFEYAKATRITLKSLAQDLEPESVDMIDQPIVDKDAVRVTGPFEIMSAGRYSVEDWKGYFVSGGDPRRAEAGKLENYIQVICRLYRKDAAVEAASGLVHAVAEDGQKKIAISIGPLSGRVTAKQIDDAVKDAVSGGIREVHVLGWAFETNVGEVKSDMESRRDVKIELVMIRPDTLAEGLKVTQPEMLFAPLAVPDIEIKIGTGKAGPEATVTLRGLAIFNRKTRETRFYTTDSGYVAAWYVDEDYDGECFVDCQMFFDFRKIPNIESLAGVEADLREFKLQSTSKSFAVRGYKRVGVKVVDVYGNESTVVRKLE